MYLRVPHPPPLATPHLEGANAFGQTAVFVAAWYGQAEAVELLARAGANVRRRSHTGATPYRAASARGHTAVLAVLKLLGVDEEEIPVFAALAEFDETDRDDLPGEVQILLDPDCPHPGAGSRFLDGAVPEADLRMLVKNQEIQNKEALHVLTKNSRFTISTRRPLTTCFEIVETRKSGRHF